MSMIVMVVITPYQGCLTSTLLHLLSTSVRGKRKEKYGVDVICLSIACVAGARVILGSLGKAQRQRLPAGKSLINKRSTE